MVDSGANFGRSGYAPAVPTNERAAYPSAIPRDSCPAAPGARSAEIADDSDQSERLYQAIKGNGGTVRYVSLPHEEHGYAARESVEHTLYEMAAWLDRHVKQAK